MPGEVTRNGRAALLCAIVAVGMAGCQSTVETKPPVQAALPAGNMDSDIRQILTAGGLNPSAPGQLKTNRMPPDVQQAVAALQGVSAPSTGPASAPVAPAAPTLMASAQPDTTLTGSRTGLLPAPLPLPQASQLLQPPAPSLAAGKKGRQNAPPVFAAAQSKGAPVLQAGLQPKENLQPGVSEIDETAARAYLPSPMPRLQTVVITGPGSRPIRGEAVERSAPAPRRTASAAPARVSVMAKEVLKPVATPVDDGVRVRRF